VFTLRSPQEIVFGWGAIEEVAELARRYGLSRPLVVVGGGSLRRRGVLERLLGQLEEVVGDVALLERIEHDPSVETIDGGREVFAAGDCDSVIAVGGGSVMDAGKAIAGLWQEDAPTAEFVGGRAITTRACPVICATTTAGTGSEVTHVSVLTDHARRLKASIRTDSMMPVAAVVDPELTLGSPAELTAFSGLDAFTQAVESYVSVGANDFSDVLALEAAVRTGRWVRTACREADNREARENMSLGSMMAGLSLASARLGLVHGIAHPLGALYGLAHGKACAVLLPHVMEFNAPACEAKFAKLARALGVTDEPSDTLATLHLVVWVRELCAALGCWVPFKDFGLKREDYPAIVEATMASGSSKANPRKVTEDAVARVLDGGM
jgi:1,3-propanediol dehydrogenase/alcohol dehydrogenase